MDNNLTIVKGIPEEVREQIGNENLEALRKVHSVFGGTMWVLPLLVDVPMVIMDCPTPPSDDDFLRELHKVLPCSIGREEWDLAYAGGDGLGNLHDCTVYTVED